MKATLTLNVTFEGEDADAATCKGQLEDLVRFAAQHGLMTGEFDMTVADFDYRVETTDGTPCVTTELARLEAELAAAGGRGVELAEQIDELRAELGVTL